MTCLNKIFLYVFMLMVPAIGFCSKFDWVQLTDALCSHPEQFDLRQISGGTTNKNFHLKIANRDFLVRMPLSDTNDLGASLELEYEVLEKIAHLDLSPRVYYYRADKNILITEYIHHDEYAIDFCDEYERKVALQLIKTVHDSGLSISHCFDPYETIKLSLQSIKSKGISLPSLCDSLLPEIVEAIEKTDAFHDWKVLCHHDIHPGNILRCGNRYLLIDWEYAAMSDPLFELASIASLSFLDDAQMLDVLKDYDLNYTVDDFQRMLQLRLLADIRWFLWSEIQRDLHPNDSIYRLWSDQYLSQINLRCHCILF
jgi:thiamine kinase-like enzyme